MQKALPTLEVINGVTPLEQWPGAEHPRLFLTRDSLARLRSRLTEQPWQAMLQRLRSAAANRLPEAALAYVLTDEPEYLDAATDRIRQLVTKAAAEELPTGTLHQLAMAYDWLWHDLDEELRDATRDGLDRRCRERWLPLAQHELYVADGYIWNIAQHYFSDVITPALALYGDVPDVAPRLRYVIDRCRTITQALSQDGVSPEGICYGGFFTDYYIQAVTLVKDLLGVDFFRGNAYLQKVPWFYLYSMLPPAHQTAGNVHLHFGDSVRRNWYGPAHFLQRLAAEYRDGIANWVAATQTATGATAGQDLFSLLWYDDTVPAVPPDRLPRQHHFRDQDLVFMRSDWGDDAAVFGFHCGPHAGHHALANYTHCIGGGHMACDAGSFQLFAFGDWLISDAGYAYKHTEYRNTVLVNGIGQTGDSQERSEWFECTELRREQRGPAIVQASHTDELDYVIGDVAPAYEHQAGLRRYYRHVIYLRPAGWIVVDELAASQPSTFELFFHAWGEEFQTDRPFRPAGEKCWISGGRTGSVRIRSLLPERIAGGPEIQSIKGIGAHRDREMNILRLQNPEPSDRVLFVTLLEAYRTDAGPVISAQVEDAGSRPLVVFTREDGRQHRVSLQIGLPWRSPHAKDVPPFPS